MARQGNEASEHNGQKSRVSGAQKRGHESGNAAKYEATEDGLRGWR